MIDEKFNLMLQSKADIRQAIVNKGVDMSGVDFTGFASKIDEIIVNEPQPAIVFETQTGAMTRTGGDKVIDLSEEKQIISAMLHGSYVFNNGTCQCYIDASNDNTTWTNVADGGRGGYSQATVSELPTKYRYIRFRYSQTNNGNDTTAGYMVTYA